MELDRELIRAMLNHLREHSNYGTMSLYFESFPEEYTNRKIGFHVEYCIERGYMNGRVSADSIMAEVSLTPRGLKYLEDQLK
ncbi:MAG: hypothetical protein OXI80_13265 [Caldilineaceae bacterium]|nr:hypothetical protein [Caldilineaceae bacterium]MDE0338634.1 hypothetical protein [Caldilineaceae bacterium]